VKQVNLKPSLDSFAVKIRHLNRRSEIKSSQKPLAGVQMKILIDLEISRLENPAVLMSHQS
jgi:hypothetical protein